MNEAGQPEQVYPDSEGGLVREFREFAEFVKDSPPMEKRQISVRTIRAVAAVLPPDPRTTEEVEFQRQLAHLTASWGGVYIDSDQPGILRANNDPTTGLLVGRFAPVIAEIINCAVRGESNDQR